MTEHRYRHLSTLRPPPGFDSLVTVGVGPDGGAVAMWSVESGPVALSRHESWSGQPVSVTVVSGMPVAHPQVQALPGGDLLIVGARCRWQDGAAEHNAVVVDPEGAVRRSGTLGDGIAHVLVDAAGDIWTGYFDEGVFGNYGWGVDGPEPLGAAGIVRWSATFDPVWRYSHSDYWPADCYTLNVADDAVWACTYTDFPIISIRNGFTDVLPTRDVSGPQGVVVAGDQVGTIGDYQDGGALLVAHVGDIRQPRHTRLAMPDGSTPRRAPLCCRGSVAHLFIGREWFAFDLADAI